MHAISKLCCPLGVLYLRLQNIRVAKAFENWCSIFNRLCTRGFKMWRVQVRLVIFLSIIYLFFNFLLNTFPKCFTLNDNSICYKKNIATIVGSWRSRAVRETEWGDIIFECCFAKNGQMELVMIPVDFDAGLPLRRNSTYKIIGRQLILPIMNNGNPINFMLKDDELILEISNEPKLKLYKKLKPG